MFQLNVYYEDTDAGGIVYYANYMKFLERARSKLLIDKGFSHTILKNKFNIMIVVKSCEIDFIKSAKLEDVLIIYTSLIKKTKIQIFLEQNIYRKNTIILKAKIRLITTTLNGKVSRMPLDLFNIF